MRSLLHGNYHFVKMKNGITTVDDEQHTKKNVLETNVNIKRRNRKTNNNNKNTLDSAAEKKEDE